MLALTARGITQLVASRESAAFLPGLRAIPAAFAPPRALGPALTEVSPRAVAAVLRHRRP